jgi:hypothetical protein
MQLGRTEALADQAGEPQVPKLKDVKKEADDGLQTPDVLLNQAGSHAGCAARGAMVRIVRHDTLMMV